MIKNYYYFSLASMPLAASGGMLSNYKWCNEFQQYYRFWANIHRLQVQTAVSNNNTESTLTMVRFCLFNSKLGQCAVRHDSSTFRWDRMSVILLLLSIQVSLHGLDGM
jgi:hypothetical protein